MDRRNDLADPHAPRGRECAIFGCGRTVTRGRLCGIHLENFSQGLEVIWDGGELTPRAETVNVSLTAWLEHDGSKPW